MTRMRFETRIPHAFDLRLAFEPLGHLERVAAMLLDAQIQRLQTADVKPGIKRGRHGARGILQERDLVADLLVVEHDRAADHVGMAADVLGRRVDHHVGAIIERMLQHRGCEGVVHRDLRAVRMRDRGCRRNIGDVEQRVARRLHPDPLVMLGFECRAHRRGVGDVDHVKVHAPRHEHLGQQAVSAAVHVVAEQDTVARLQGGAQQHVNRGEAG